MKFKTAELINRIDVLIQERHADAEAAHVEKVQTAANAREEWLATHSEGYVIFANRVKDKIRKGRPILRSDIPREIAGRYDGLAVFQGPSGVPAKKEAVTSDLTTLKAALEAVADEYVTTTGLREIGFKDIARLFRTGK